MFQKFINPTFVSAPCVFTHKKKKKQTSQRTFHVTVATRLSGNTAGQTSLLKNNFLTAFLIATRLT